MPQARVIIADFQKGAVDVEQKILGDLAEVVPLDVSSEEQLWGRVEDAAAIMVYHTLKVTQATLARLTHCKLIVRCGVGYDNVDYVFARSRGIPVANVPDYGNEEVADSALGLMLGLTRGIAYQNTHLRDAGVAWRYDHVAPLYRLRGRTVGIIGLGRIGTAIAKRLSAFGCEIFYHNRTPVDGSPHTYVGSPVELARRVEVLIVATAGGSGTQGLVGREVIDALGADGYLVNIARGSVVDEDALVDALLGRRLAGAGLDGFADEPNVPEALLTMDNVVLLPHVASGTVETRTAMVELTLRNLDSFLKAGKLVTPVPMPAAASG